MPAVRPKVGVGVFVTSPSKPRHVLLGERLGSHGANTFALPGGHLEFGESWHDCAAREVLEETGLVLRTPRCATVLNVVERATDYHYVVIFMAAEASTPTRSRQPRAREVRGLGLVPRDEKLPTPLFGPPRCARAGLRPVQMRTLLEPSEPLPPYVCVILHEEATGASCPSSGRTTPRRRASSRASAARARTGGRRGVRRPRVRRGARGRRRRRRPAAPSISTSTAR